MKRKWLMIILVLSLAVNMAVIATVGYHYFRNTCMTPATPCPLNQESRHLYESLGLSEAQAAKMIPLSHSFHGQLASWESRIEAKRDHLLGLLGHDNIDRKAIEETRREIATLQDELQRGVVAHVIEVKGNLNPEQQKQFFEMLRSGMAGTRSNPVFPMTAGGTK
ncbi:MAG: periplasmic heavy metal sensor [Syntrophales bacterium]|nr:periplasmic heavy metal sensor [Syntrophales bacterium]